MLQASIVYYHYVNGTTMIKYDRNSEIGSIYKKIWEDISQVILIK